MKQFEFSRVSVLTALLIMFASFLLLYSCNAVPPVSAPPRKVTEEEILPPAEAREFAEETPGEPLSGGNHAEARPRHLAKDELTVAVSGGGMELDFRKSYLANEAQFFTAIYEGLFSYHPLTMAPVMAAVSNYETSEDKKVWTFTIKERARFQNGDPVRAADFKAAWLSLLDPAKESPYSSLFDIIEGARDFRLGTSGAETVGILTPSEKRLVVRLNAPAAFFPSMLCHHSFSPIHPSMLNEEDWTARRPVSNGPFIIEEIDGEHINLVKNPEYWDARQVKLNKLTIKFTDDPDEAAALWNSGQAQWTDGNINIDKLTDHSGIEAHVMFATHYYYIRSARKPWDDFRLRRALSLVLPWDEIRQGYQLPAKTLVFPISGYPEIDGLDADSTNVEEARRLLAEAGYPQGVGLPEFVIRITPSLDEARIAALMAGAWFELLGIPVKIEEVPFELYFQLVKENNYDAGFTTWIGDFADPYTFLQMWCRDSNLNDARHNDKDYEALIDKSMTQEGTKRLETLAEAEKLLLERGNVLPIFYSPSVNIVDLAEIDGWYPNELNIHPFKYMEIKTRRPLPGVVMLPHDAAKQM